mmetsp:Transcript_25224/g.58040  ORF Transcript_25224/g.58040 Transcript_25224/m.58040 type:complete len:831 (-) Transcript_25224:24-2516(-)
MGIERLEAWTERGLVDDFVRFVEGQATVQQQRGSGCFVLGLSGSLRATGRSRLAEALRHLGESRKIKWDAFCIFLLEDTFGAEGKATNNCQLLHDTLLATLDRRGITLPEGRILVPNVLLETPEACAADYQKRMLAFFKEHAIEAPHLAVLSLEDDLSIGGVFPSWYNGESDRWSQATAKMARVLVTQSLDLNDPGHICVNLTVLRRARAILVDVHESTCEAWKRVKEAFDHQVAADGEDHDGFGRTHSQPPMSRGISPDAAPNSIKEPTTPKGPRRSLMAHTSSPPFKPASPRRLVTVAGEGNHGSPLNYIMKYKHITILQIKVDVENHFSVAVIGAAGDLARKKTIPALFQLHLDNHLPPSTRIFGCDNPSFPAHADVRTVDDWWTKRLLPVLEMKSNQTARDLRDFKSRLDFVPINLDEAGTLEEVHKRIRGTSSVHKRDNRLFYLALPSFLFSTAVERIRNDCWSESGFVRVVVEKPFGRNQEEATALADKLGKHLTEPQIYRIDHYLAKTLVLNILTLRFANREFGTLFHTYHVANVRITFQEDFGVEGRAGYFNDYGIIRDIMQNHLMQVLTLIAMEAPASLEAEDVRDEKVKVLKQIRPIKPEDCVIGQYEGYQEDPQIQAVNQKRGFKSRCPTFAVVVMYCDSERWSGVPFIMKAGKALSKTQTLVRVQFKKAPPQSIFGDQPQNEMVIRIQPNEAIYYKMIAKMPGISQKARDVRRTVLDLDLKKGLNRSYRSPEAYEKLLYDVLQGESHNFVRRDELEQAWRIFDPALRKMENEDLREPLVYPFGSGGPRAADELIRSMGFQKYSPTGVAVDGFSDDEGH